MFPTVAVKPSRHGTPLFLSAVLLTLLFAGVVAGPAAAEDDGLPRVNPFSGQQEAIDAGRKLYWKFCVQCHGKKADGTSTRWGGYAKDLRKWSHGYPEFIMTVLDGRPQKRMPPWGGYLDEEEIGAIAAFLETLAIEGARWK